MRVKGQASQNFWTTPYWGLVSELSPDPDSARSTNLPGCESEPVGIKADASQQIKTKQLPGWE